MSFKTIQITGQDSTPSEGINVSISIESFFKNDALAAGNKNEIIQISDIIFNSETKELDEKVVQLGLDVDLTYYDWVPLLAKLKAIPDIDLVLIDNADSTPKITL